MAYLHRLAFFFLLLFSGSFVAAETVAATGVTNPTRTMWSQTIRNPAPDTTRWYDTPVQACQAGIVNYPGSVYVNTTGTESYERKCVYGPPGVPYQGNWGATYSGQRCLSNGAVAGSSCITYSCPAGQNWTLSGSQCVRPDCAQGETRGADGICVGPCTAGQSSTASADTGWHSKGDNVSIYAGQRNATPNCGLGGNGSGTSCTIGNVSPRSAPICVDGQNGFVRCTSFYNGTTTGGTCTPISPPDTPEPPCAGQKGYVNGVLVCLQPESQASKDNRAASAAALAAQVAANAAAVAGKSAAAQAAAAKAAGEAAAAASRTGADSAQAAAAGAAAGAAAANATQAGSSSSSSMAEGSAAGAGALAGARAQAVATAAGLSPSQVAEAVSRATAAATAAAQAAINNGATAASVANAATVAGQASTASTIYGSSAADAGAAAAAAGAGAQAGTAAGTGGGGGGTPGGTGSGAPETPVDDFCARNPQAKMCKTEMDGEFSGACGAPPVCKGDAVMCAVAAATFATNCVLKDPGVPTPLYDEAKDKTGDQTEALPGNSAVSIGVGSFDQTELLGAAAGMSDRTVVVAGHSISIPFSSVNIWLQRLGIVLQAVTFLLCARIVVRG